MIVPFCDICSSKCAVADLRYVRIVKVDDRDHSKESPVMAEREVCVHCAEHIKDHIESMRDTLDSRRNK